jgi:hypothetical protein
VVAGIGLSAAYYSVQASHRKDKVAAKADAADSEPAGTAPLMH